MSKETEKVIKEMKKYIDENIGEDTTDEHMEKLLEEFMMMQNNMPYEEVTEEMAETADDYLELAELADSDEEAIRYVKLALEIEPENLDAMVALAKLTIDNAPDMLAKFQELIKKGEEIMEKEGFMTEECMGEFWGIFETRPFIRLRRKYMDLLIICGMMKSATKEAEEILTLNEGDNLGVRYILMSIYSFLEDEDAAMKLYSKYGEYDETRLLLPLSVLYYKKMDYKKAKYYLNKLAKTNKDTKKFIKGVVNDDLEKYYDEMDAFGYQPFTIEEFLIDLRECFFAYTTTGMYFQWAQEALKTRKK